MLMVPMLHQGGLENVCVQTARLLAPFYDVTLLVFTYKDKFFDVSDLDVVNLELPAVEGRAGKAVNLLRRIRAIRAVKKERGISLTYSFGATANLANVLSRAGDRIVTGFRSSVDLENTRQVRLFCAKSDVVVCCSRDIERVLQGQYGFRNTAVLYNPLDAESIRQKAAVPAEDVPFHGNTDGRVLVSIGRDDDYKGYWHLIKALAVLHEDPAFRDVKLSLIGSGSYADYKALAAALGLKESVAFPGLKSNPFPYTAHAAGFVLSSNHEGFPNALVEAMAAGLPVLACDCLSGPREILLSREAYEQVSAQYPDGSVPSMRQGEAGFLLPNMAAEKDTTPAITGDDRSLAGELKAFLALPGEERAALAEKAAEKSLLFSTENYTVALRQILESI